MIKLIILLLPLLLQAQTIKANLVSVYDGDTITVLIDSKYEIFQKMKVRINNIDTPEKNGKCYKEKKLANKAKYYLIGILKDKQIVLHNLKWGKYGGRVLADVYADGVNVADRLISMDLAREYHGEKKEGWCDGTQK